MTKKIRSKSLQDRFWSKVDKTDSCWNWTGSTLPRETGGHGQIGVDRKVIGVHRVSAMLHGLRQPNGHVFTLASSWHVLHTCNNAKCVNPSHLYVGTHKQNMEDLARAGYRKIIKGDAHHGIKVTDAQVQEIRALRASGMSRKQVSVKFRITPTHITRICKGRSRS